MRLTSEIFVLVMFLFTTSTFFCLILYEAYFNYKFEIIKHFKDVVQHKNILFNLHPISGRSDSCKSCFSHNYKLVINNPNICRHNEREIIDAIILIFSAHDRKYERDTIRKTWLTYARNNTSNVRYAFLLGISNLIENQISLLKENENHHDILQEDFTDSYKNLTLKTIMAFKWASTFCSDAKLVMKTDDDVYVNIIGLLHVTKTSATKFDTSVGGYCKMEVSPIRDPESKWFVSYFSYSKSVYPEFCSGTGYVTSVNVAKKVFDISKHVPFFHLEDVYVSMCMKKLNFTLRNIPGFYNYPIRNNPCVYKADGFVSSHQIPPEEMRRIWDFTC